MPLTVVIVDVHAGFRRSARALLEASGFSVVGEAADGDGAVTAVDRYRPAVVLLDIQLPGEDGFAVAERISGRQDPPIVILISSREADMMVPGWHEIPRTGSSGSETCLVQP